MSEQPSADAPFHPKAGYSAFVLGVLLLAYILNFVDRQILALVLGHRNGGKGGQLT